MEFIEANGIRLHYQLDGDAGSPVLVLSNSLGADLTMWDAQMPVLTQHFRVLRYDTRGHGASDVPPGPYHVEQLGQDVLGLLDALHLDRVRFCGLSMGGMTGIWLGVHAPGRLEKLALCNTAAKFGTAEIWNARIDLIRAGGMKEVADATIGRWFRPQTIEDHPDRVAHIRDVLLKTPVAGYIANCAAVRDGDQRASVSHIHLPTLVIAGRDDRSATPEDGQWLAQQIPGARYVELSAAHLSNIDAAPDFTDALVQFMR